jgi:hypothetical protein
MVDMIKYLNFNKRLPENHMFYISSLEGDYATFYNTKTNKIEKISKIDLFGRLLANSFDKFEDLMKYLEKNTKLKNLINQEKIEYTKKIYEEKKLFFFSNKSNRKFYNFNINELGYNNKDLIIETWSKLPINQKTSDNFQIIEEPKNETEQNDLNEINNILENNVKNNKIINDDTFIKKIPKKYGEIFLFIDSDDSDFDD